MTSTEQATPTSQATTPRRIDPPAGEARRPRRSWNAVLSATRLWTGLILFAFVLFHLINHAFGIISIEIQDRVADVLMAPWYNPIGAAVVGFAAIIHIAVNLYTLWSRRTLRLKPWEAVQYISGLLIPWLIIEHALANGLMDELYGSTSSYAVMQGFLWVVAPYQIWKQCAALIVAWVHGVIGLWHWLRVRSWFDRSQTLLLIIAVIIPVLSLAGFISAGNESIRMHDANPEYLAGILAEAGWNWDDLGAMYQLYVSIMRWYWGILIALAVLWIIRRARSDRKAARITIDGGKSMAILPGATLLETLRANNIPHASVCGGRGRCTTCRVVVQNGLDHLPSPEAVESAALKRIGSPERVRLACQISPTQAMTVSPLLSAKATPSDGRRPGALLGREQLVTVLFVDMRGSTRLGEAKLPFDTLFILNQFFIEMTAALRETGGHYANFTGDGLMAIYGLQGAAEAGCRDALRGAQAMLDRLKALNERLEGDLPEPIRIGIGIHTGEAIVGEMGPPEARLVSAIGDTVNTAARLESMSKEFGEPVVISEETLRIGRITLPGTEPVETTVRGRQQSIGVFPTGTLPDTT